MKAYHPEHGDGLFKKPGVSVQPGGLFKKGLGRLAGDSSG